MRSLFLFGEPPAGIELGEHAEEADGTRTGTPDLPRRGQLGPLGLEHVKKAYLSLVSAWVAFRITGMGRAHTTGAASRE